MYHIATYTAPVGGSGGAVFFTGIPQNFTHLQFRLFTRSGNTGANAGVFMPGNSYHQVYGDGATVVSSGFASVVNGVFNTVGNSSTANIFSTSIVDILDYSNTNKSKTVKVISGQDSNGSGLVQLFSARIEATTAISSFFFDVGGPNFFAQHSRFDLYGITTSQATGA
jgi:hypothetical protein